MAEYERRAGGNINLSEFTYVVTKILLPETKAWADEIPGERDEFWKRQELTDRLGEEEAVDLHMRELQDEYYGK